MRVRSVRMVVWVVIDDDKSVFNTNVGHICSVGVAVGGGRGGGTRREPRLPPQLVPL